MEKMIIIYGHKEVIMKNRIIKIILYIVYICENLFVWEISRNYLTGYILYVVVGINALITYNLFYTNKDNMK